MCIVQRCLGRSTCFHFWLVRLFGENPEVYFHVACAILKVLCRNKCMQNNKAIVAFTVVFSPLPLASSVSRHKIRFIVMDWFNFASQEKTVLFVGHGTGFHLILCV